MVFPLSLRAEKWLVLRLSYVRSLIAKVLNHLSISALLCLPKQNGEVYDRIQSLFSLGLFAL